MSPSEWFFLGVLVSILLGFIFNFFNKRMVGKVEEEADEEISNVKDEVEKTKDEIENIKRGKN